MNELDMSPVVYQVQRVQAANRSNLSKEDQVKLDFQAMLLKEIYLKSLVSSKWLDDEDDTMEEDETAIPSSSTLLGDVATDVGVDQLSVKLAKEDVFGMTRYLERGKQADASRH